MTLSKFATGRKHEAPDLRADLIRAGSIPNRNYYETHHLERHLRMRKAAPKTILQPRSYLMDQLQKPSCVGKSYQGRLNALLGVDPSGVGIWTLAREFEGSLANADEGTTPAAAIAVLLRNGWTPRHDGEDSQPVSQDVILPTLDDELAAFDNQLPRVYEHFTCVGTPQQIKASVIDALERGYAVSFGTGVLSPYEEPPPDTVLDESYLSSDSDEGHEQGLFGYVAESDAFAVQGSWGEWTWCMINDQRAKGCCLVSPEVVCNAYAVDVLRVREWP